MVLSPVCLFRRDEVIGEKEKWSWVGRVGGGGKYGQWWQGREGQMDRGRKGTKNATVYKWAQQGQDGIKLNKKWTKEVNTGVIRGESYQTLTWMQRETPTLCTFPLKRQFSFYTGKKCGDLRPRGNAVSLSPSLSTRLRFCDFRPLFLPALHFSFCLSACACLCAGLQ